MLRTDEFGRFASELRQAACSARGFPEPHVLGSEPWAAYCHPYSAGDQLMAGCGGENSQGLQEGFILW
ncbi:hypothetical protein SKAU_G00303810 [Synaphobranchus kaupii]|uniref:Uncharacterized protein n=1 Tax=Synaphobranchus kaupii TaxID=118154 RepID=A0A9Q1EW84_SYNKA|nr:hypothetical protein SKAU_G00303810 [Synaphobranchus kaupii]